MIVYRFKFDAVIAESGITSEFIKFIESLMTDDEDVFNYLPSKKDVILGLQDYAYDSIIKFANSNINYKFEFEEHSKEERTLTQFVPGNNPTTEVYYLLPLFSPESYLEL